MGIWTWLRRYESPVDGPTGAVRRLPRALHRGGALAVVLLEARDGLSPSLVQVVHDVVSGGLAACVAITISAPSEVAIGLTEADARTLCDRLIAVGAVAAVEPVQDVPRPSAEELALADRARAAWHRARSALAEHLRSAMAPPPVEELSTHRAWHALHVALTGRETGGDRPASEVVAVESVAALEVEVVHWPEDVCRIARYLVGVDARAAERSLEAAIARGVYVYSAELGNVLDDVRRFYVAAAEAHQIVVIHRG